MSGQYEALDLFAGEGGMTKGLQRAGFRVTAVDTVAARLARNPAEVTVKTDALEYVAENGHKFDYIHAGPTCTGYSRGTAAVPYRLEKYDRLIPATRDLLRATGKPYTIENVEDAKSELETPLMLCWTHFYEPGTVEDDDGTPLWMRRHRLFESNVPLLPASECWHPAGMQCAGAYGGARRDKHEARNVRKGGYVPRADVMRALLVTPWMSQKGAQLCVPPAYGEWIGWQIIEQGIEAR